VAADPTKAKEIAKTLQELDDLIQQLKNDLKNNPSVRHLSFLFFLLRFIFLFDLFVCLCFK
jgi:hypothetical protein